MLKALLLDLDGTLLPMDTDAFLRQYLRSIGQHVAHLTDPRQFTEHLMAATEVMIRDTDKKVSNQEVFWADFLQRVDVPADKLLPVVDDFYVTRFPELKEHTFPTPLSKNIVETAGNKGLQVVVATNPVFPTTAIEERLRWIDLHDYPFALVTTYEKMHFCKPQIGYYAEILELLGLEGQECMMVGNDAYEDLVAAELGLQTYLVQDYLIPRDGVNFKPDYQGNLAEFLQFITEFNA